MPSATYWCLGAVVDFRGSGDGVGTGPDVEAHALEGEIAEEVVDFQVVLLKCRWHIPYWLLGRPDQRVCPVGAADIAIAEHGAEGKDRVQRPSWSWCIMAVV